MSRSALIDKTKEDASITDEDVRNEPVVDIGQVDPVSILIYTLQVTVDHKQLHWLLVSNCKLGVYDMRLGVSSIYSQILLLIETVGWHILAFPS